jgi:hypothetical protein
MHRDCVVSYRNRSELSLCNETRLTSVGENTMHTKQTTAHTQRKGQRARRRCERDATTEMTRTQMTAHESVRKSAYRSCSSAVLAANVATSTRRRETIPTCTERGAERPERVSTLATQGGAHPRRTLATAAPTAHTGDCSAMLAHCTPLVHPQHTLMCKADELTDAGLTGLLRSWRNEGRS